MKNLYIRFEYDEAIEGKKQMLSSQADFLELLKSFKNYKHTRERELILKNRLKIRWLELQNELANIMQFFPQEAEEEKEVESLRRETKNKIKILETPEKKEYETIESELNEIQRKLARLS